MRKPIILAGALAASLTLSPVAHADDETDFLRGLNYGGIAVYNTTAAVNSGYEICRQIALHDGDKLAVVSLFYNTAAYDEVPTRQVAMTWVAAAVVNLCPWYRS